MFDSLSQKLQNIFSPLIGKKTLSEDNLTDAVREVRLALLEADVNYSVAKTFVQRVKEKVVGQEVVKSISPGQQFIKIIHDELALLMGHEESTLDLKKKPTVIMVCGLQGSGKTTFCGKLATYLKKHNLAKKPLLVACDRQRPAAIEQLKVLAQKAEVAVFDGGVEKVPLTIVKEAMKLSVAEGYDVVILDTAGRLQIDEPLMQELEGLKKYSNPAEVLFVANAMTGQEAVNIAKAFHDRVAITGTVLTMLDGSARGGAAISIREVTGQPLKFEGIGEKLEDLQVFNPHSMADRILGMGDVINLVKKAQAHIDEKEALKMEEKLRKASFNYEDFLKQMAMVKKMGSLKNLLKMIPGGGALGDLDLDDNVVKRQEAMILSMTLEERQEKVEIDVGRRRRIAKGSGSTLEDVNRLIKSFKRAKQMIKSMPKFKNMEKMMGGMTSWR